MKDESAERKALLDQYSLNMKWTKAIEKSESSTEMFSTEQLPNQFSNRYGSPRPGRPPKRSSGIPSPEPGNYGSSTPISSNQQGANNLLPLLGFSNSKKARYSDDCDYTNESKLRDMIYSNKPLTVHFTRRSGVEATKQWQCKFVSFQQLGGDCCSHVGGQWLLGCLSLSAALERSSQLHAEHAAATAACGSSSSTRSASTSQ